MKLKNFIMKIISKLDKLPENFDNLNFEEHNNLKYFII